MKKIWKAALYPKTAVAMPEGSTPLDVQVQRGEPQVWFLCDPDKPVEIRMFSIYGTGLDMPDDPGRYIGTFQLDAGALVFHVFEDGPIGAE